SPLRQEHRVDSERREVVGRRRLRTYGRQLSHDDEIRLVQQLFKAEGCPQGSLHAGTEGQKRDPKKGSFHRAITCPSERFPAELLDYISCRQGRRLCRRAEPAGEAGALSWGH